MAAFDLTKFKVLSFDIYGTLIDWETGIFHSLSPLFPPSTSKTDIIDAYMTHEMAIQKETPTLPYPSVLAEIYKRIATDLSVSFSPSDATAFAQTIGTWKPWPDTVAAMQYLGTHYKLIALSNVDNASFSRTLAGPLAEVKFDALYTAETIGSYKPDLKNFQYLVDNAEKSFGAKKHEICHVGIGLVHDHVPAKTFGLQPSIYISRDEGPEKLDTVKDDVQLGGVFKTLGDFAVEVRRAFGEP